MAPISKADLDQISTVIASSVSQAIAQAFAQQAASQPKAAIPAQAYQYIKTSPFLPKGSKMAAIDLASKDARIVAAFSRRGFKVTLMDRNDPAKPFDVHPFKGWLHQGQAQCSGNR
jgi:hypothetical protein